MWDKSATRDVIKSIYQLMQAGANLQTIKRQIEDLEKWGDVSDLGNRKYAAYQTMLTKIYDHIKAEEKRSAEGQPAPPPDAWTCESCGRQNDASNNFCGGCGSPKPSP